MGKLLSLGGIARHILEYNDCVKLGRSITPKGIVIHSTGCNQKKISAYVSSWNRAGVDVCVHAFIGVLDDGTVGIIQTMPWDMRCWGVGKGKKGTYNDTHIQFEICEDGLEDERYFVEVFALAADLCALLCQKYHIDPEQVVSHAESYQLGYGTNHADCDHWLRRFGQSMQDIRRAIKKRLEEAPIYSRDAVVQAMITDGITAPENALYWERFLAGDKDEARYCRTLFWRYHEALKGG